MSRDVQSRDNHGGDSGNDDNDGSNYDDESGSDGDSTDIEMNEDYGDDDDCHGNNSRGSIDGDYIDVETNGDDDDDDDDDDCHDNNSRGSIDDTTGSDWTDYEDEDDNNLWVFHLSSKIFSLRKQHAYNHCYSATMETEAYILFSHQSISILASDTNDGWKMDEEDKADISCWWHSLSVSYEPISVPTDTAKQTKSQIV